MPTFKNSAILGILGAGNWAWLLVYVVWYAHENVHNHEFILVLHLEYTVNIFW